MGLALHLRALLSDSWSGKDCKAVGCCSGSLSNAFLLQHSYENDCLGGQACMQSQVLLDLVAEELPEGTKEACCYIGCGSTLSIN